MKLGQKCNLKIVLRHSFLPISHTPSSPAHKLWPFLLNSPKGWIFWFSLKAPAWVTTINKSPVQLTSCCCVSGPDTPLAVSTMTAMWFGHGVKSPLKKQELCTLCSNCLRARHTLGACVGCVKWEFKNIPAALNFTLYFGALQQHWGKAFLTSERRMPGKGFFRDSLGSSPMTRWTVVGCRLSQMCCVTVPAAAGRGFTLR